MFRAGTVGLIFKLPWCAQSRLPAGVAIGIEAGAATVLEGLPRSGNLVEQRATGTQPPAGG